MEARTITFPITLALCGLSGIAHAQWTATYLHPAGATESVAYDVRNGQIGGYVTINGHHRAALWAIGAEGFIDLTPPGYSDGEIQALSSGSQAGAARPTGTNWWQAGTWSGTSASWVNMHPPSMMSSVVWAVSGGQQAGWASEGAGGFASLWSGTAASWINLHPDIAVDSAALGIDGDTQVGRADISIQEHASLWRGTAASFVDLHPAALGPFGMSQATAVSGGQQVGFASYGGEVNTHASLWTGSPDSWQDLQPIDAIQSEAFAVYGGMQAGEATFGTNDSGSWIWRAGVWSGTAASWEDLSPALSGSWSGSIANAIWNDGTTVYVVGSATDAATQTMRAVLWTRPLIACGSADFNCDGDVGTDQDIEAFFACLAGNCPAAPCPSTADFNADGDVGTDADIEAFFRVLAGGNC